MLLAAMRDRHLVPADQVMDVRFDEYMADQMGVLHRVYGLAGVDLTDEAVRLLRDGDRRPTPWPPRPGRPTTSKTSGSTPAERRAALRPYQERFDVPDEPLDGR